MKYYNLVAPDKYRGGRDSYEFAVHTTVVCVTRNKQMKISVTYDMARARWKTLVDRGYILKER